MIEVAPRSAYMMSYDEAILYCQFLDYNGHKDWRMLTRQEHSEYRNEIYGLNVHAQWVQSDDLQYPGNIKYWVYPVRDI